jgi:ribosomal protein S27E
MKTTRVDANGNVRCPTCGARNSFTVKRTGKAKWGVGPTFGVAALGAPKRLKCNGCGTNLKRG